MYSGLYFILTYELYVSIFYTIQNIEKDTLFVLLFNVTIHNYGTRKFYNLLVLNIQIYRNSRLRYREK